MKLTVTDHAAAWYIEELDLAEGDELRFYARYGGCGIVSGFSLGVRPAVPNDALAQFVKDGIVFFIENDDAWYFQGKDLHIRMSDQADEPFFDYM